MKTIDLNFDITSLDGNVLGNAGKLIGTMLVSDNRGEALKFYDWAVKLHEGKSIRVDDADFKKIYKFIENNDNIFIITKAPILRYLDSIKHEERQGEN